MVHHLIVLNPASKATAPNTRSDIAGQRVQATPKVSSFPVIRSYDGVLRIARNLMLACMIEAIRCRNKTIGIKNVNSVLIQPHWRIEKDIEKLL